MHVIQGPHAGDVTKHRVNHLPKLTVCLKTMIDFVSKGCLVAGKVPHVHRYIHPAAVPQHNPVAALLPGDVIRLHAGQANLLNVLLTARILVLVVN